MNDIWNIIQCFYFNRMLEYGIPQDIAVKATNNWGKGDEQHTNEKTLKHVFSCSTLSNYLGGFFLWHKSEEGSIYWSDLIYKDLKYLQEMWDLVEVDKVPKCFTVSWTK